MYRVSISIDQCTQNPLLRGTIPTSYAPCLVCETDVDFETLTFSSTNVEYQLLSSHSQLHDYDYSYWVERCSGKLFTFSLEERFHDIFCDVFGMQ